MRQFIPGRGHNPAEAGSHANTAGPGVGLCANVGSGFSRIAAITCLFLAAFLIGVGKQAAAQGVGVQGGFTVDPEHASIGSHFETGELLPQFRFRPGIDGDFGNGNLTTASINIEFLYFEPLSRSSWALYQGAGPAIVLLRQRVLRVGQGVREDTSVHAGTFVTFGFAHESGFFTEFKLGRGSSPSLRFAVGYTVRRKTP